MLNLIKNLNIYNVLPLNKIVNFEKTKYRIDKIKTNLF